MSLNTKEHKVQEKDHLTGIVLAPELVVSDRRQVPEIFSVFNHPSGVHNVK
jgi:hypothetical protein